MAGGRGAADMRLSPRLPAILTYVFLGKTLTCKSITGLVLVGWGTIIVQLKPRKNM